MTCQDNEILLNNTLIQMSCSFLQYVSESWPWVRLEATSIEEQVRVLAARQRQDVGEIVNLLSAREYHIDFGSFPTEYTDQQFLGLNVLIGRLKHSQKLICDRITNVRVSLESAGDAEGAEVMRIVSLHESDVLKALADIERELQPAVAKT
jgi:hypothetical protein